MLDPGARVVVAARIAGLGRDGRGADRADPGDGGDQMREVQLVEDLHHAGLRALRLGQRREPVGAGVLCPLGQGVLPGFDATWDRRGGMDGRCDPLSLLADLMGQIRCDAVSFEGLDSTLRTEWFWQGIPDWDEDDDGDLDQAHWEHYWDCQPCHYADRSGDLRRITKVSDFYSARQWHSIGMYCDLGQGVRATALATWRPATWASARAALARR